MLADKASKRHRLMGMKVEITGNLKKQVRFSVAGIHLLNEGVLIKYLMKSLLDHGINRKRMSHPNR